MEQELNARLQQLVGCILDVKDRVAALGEQPDYRSEDADACRQAVEDVGADYRAILESASESERALIERKYGRQVIDLRRFASWLPVKTHGDSVPLATDNPWSFGSPTPSGGAQPAPPPPPHVPVPSGPRVGGEIEAWCGSCKELRTHTIVAMLNQDPKQVICRTCDAKHGFRLSPARGRKTTPSSRKKKGTISRLEAKRQREETEKSAFQKELAESKDVRPFSKETRVRYRAGQIIDHPEHGRGKIENVVKGSLVVRFRSGRRPVSLY